MKGYPPQSKTFNTKIEAETWAKTLESEMLRGVFVSRAEAERTTLGEALDRYAREVTKHKKGAAQELIRIAAWKRHPLAQRYLATIRSIDFAGYRDSRMANGMAPATIRLELAIISNLFTVARKEWGMESLGNPVADIRKPKVDNARERRLHGDEEMRLTAALDGCTNPYIKPLVLFALETAMRQGELLSLDWRHVDVKKLRAWLPDTKNGEGRAVPLSSRAIAVLSALPRAISGRVFDTTAMAVKLAFPRACKRAGIEDLHFHDLRHEAASRFFEHGLNIMEVASITGHKDLKMLKRYTHLRAEDLAKKLG